MEVPSNAIAGRAPLPAAAATATAAAAAAAAAVGAAAPGLASADAALIVPRKIRTQELTRAGLEESLPLLAAKEDGNTRASTGVSSYALAKLFRPPTTTNLTRDMTKAMKDMLRTCSRE